MENKIEGYVGKIAREIGVSKVSVYYALNDKKGQRKLRAEIKQYAKALGYVSKQSMVEAKNKGFSFITKIFSRPRNNTTRLSFILSAPSAIKTTVSCNRFYRKREHDS